MQGAVSLRFDSHFPSEPEELGIFSHVSWPFVLTFVFAFTVVSDAECGSFSESRELFQ